MQEKLLMVDTSPLAPLNPLLIARSLQYYSTKGNARSARH